MKRHAGQYGGLGFTIFALVLLVPVVAAEQFKDASNDVIFDAYDQANVPAEDAEVDILRLWVDGETRTSLEFGFETSAPGPTDDGGLFGWKFSFRIDGAHYELNGNICAEGEVSLRRFENSILSDNQCIPYQVMGTSRAITVEKADLLGFDRQPIGFGSTITDLQLEVYRNAGFPANRWLDLGPDQAVPNALTLSVAGTLLGDVQWHIEKPIQFSNGVLGLFTTEMQLTNSGAEDAKITFKDSPPASWKSLAPTSVLVPTGESIIVPLAFIPPGAHAHGGGTRWPITAFYEDLSAEDEIGLDFFMVPQPAGHHPRIYLHGANVPGPGLPGATTEDYWMNALESDPNSEEIRVRNGQNNFVGGLWEALLRPVLVQNIAIVPGAGLATVRAYAEQPVTEGTAIMDIVYCDPGAVGSGETIYFYSCPFGSPYLIARGETSFDTQTGGPFELDFELPIEQAATIITAKNDAFGMGLQLTVAGPWGPGDQSPITIETTGTFFELPLVDRAQASNSARSLGLEIEVWSPSECLPEGGVHAVELVNPGPAGTLEWAAISSAGSQIILPAPVLLEAGESRRFEMPVGSEPGTYEDFGAIMASLDGQAFAWLSWQHVGDCPMSESLSDAIQASKLDKGTPTPLVAVLGAVIAVAWAKQRNRQ